MNDKVVVTSKEDLQFLVSEAVKKAVSEIKPVDRQNKKEIFTTREAMKYLGVSRSTLQRWRESDLLPFRKINGSIRYMRSDLLEMLDDAKSVPEGK